LSRITVIEGQLTRLGSLPSTDANHIGEFFPEIQVGGIISINRDGIIIILRAIVMNLGSVWIGNQLLRC